MDWTPIISAVTQGLAALIGVLVSVAVAFLAGYLKQLAANAKSTAVKAAVTEAVEAAQQLYPRGQNAEKLDFVTQALARKGLVVPDAAVESAVFAVKQTTKEACPE